MKIKILLILLPCFLVFQKCGFAQAEENEKFYLSLNEADSATIASIIKLSTQLYRNDPDKALSLTSKALELATANQNVFLQSRAHSITGVILKNQGKFAEALSSHYKSKEINDSLNLLPALASNYNDIGIIYKTMGEFDIALESYLKSNAICVEIGLDRGTIMSFNNIGTIYEAKNDSEKAIYYYNLAYDKAVESEILDAQAIALNNLGEIYATEGDGKTAQDFFRRTLAIDQKTNDKVGSSYSILNLAGTFIGQRAWDSALFYYDKAEHLAHELEANQLFIHVYHGKTKVMEDQGKFEKALEMNRLAEAFKDSLYNETRTQQLAEAEARYEAKKKDQEIALLEQDRMLKDLTIKQHYAERIALMSLIVLGALIIWYLFKRNKARQNELFSRKLIKQKELNLKTIVETQETERKRIAKDLHDGIGQTLSGIRLAMESLSLNLKYNLPEESEQIKTLTQHIDGACKEVRAISHQMMPRILQEDGLIPAIEDMLEKSFKYSSITYQYEHFGIDKRFSENVEVSLYRIAQELINNIIKHSGANRVQVQLFRLKKMLVLLIEDNGSGFEFEKQKNKGIGLMNITSRVETVHGEFNLEPSPDSGTLATIRIPIV
ncbi:MAG: sensor histidine kinase [Bacteroidetes bacterium]|jgi:two-component system NarL family sensor kinase|nr:sensor histidine kinase [Bacteroidota bacterium]